ncbi:MAG: hypothetical protein L0229_25315 [Blastocatellia bacterium]|nr:hypothetical protein [Blastocatellia bacterium]
MNNMNRMRRTKAALPALLAAVLVLAGLAPVGASEAYSQRRTRRTPAPPPSVYDQGYLKGYSDGFRQGGLDWRQAAPRNFEQSESYEKRESNYDPKHASSDFYQQGYKLGFELGYTDGYFGRAENKAVPSNGEELARVIARAQAQREARREARDSRREGNEPRRDTSGRDTSGRDTSRRGGPVSLNIPRDTEMQIRLTSPIETKNNRVGDKFTAVVISPSPYDGATIEGHIATLKKSGKVTGRTELGLAFDKIILEDGRSADIEVELKEIIESETVKKVDEEGKVESGSRSKDSQVRGGVGAVAGAVIGGILGGAKGALLGAVIGGAAGVGTVYIEGSKDLILEPGTDMIIRVLRVNAR